MHIKHLAYRRLLVKLSWCLWWRWQPWLSSPKSTPITDLVPLPPAYSPPSEFPASLSLPSSPEPWCVRLPSCWETCILPASQTRILEGRAPFPSHTLHGMGPQLINVTGSSNLSLQGCQRAGRETSALCIWVNLPDLGRNSHPLIAFHSFNNLTHSGYVPGIVLGKWIQGTRLPKQTSLLL